VQSGELFSLRVRSGSQQLCSFRLPGQAALGAPHTGSDAMKKPRKDPVRENRIHEEAIVDAYGPEEKAMSWYYYLESKLSFPFRAKCTASKITSPLRAAESRGSAPKVG
jgi:hypothetical protein